MLSFLQPECSMPIPINQRLIGTISLLLASSVAQNEFADVSIVETCPIQCALPGTASCQQGRQGNAYSPLDSLWKPPLTPELFSLIAEDSSYFCLCKPGYTGSDCSIAVDSCTSATESHDIAVCLHGGTCQEEGSCDCSTAYHGGSKYVGQNCEVEVPREVYCPIEKGTSTSESQAYCLNGGTCSSSPQDPPYCSCPSGYEGDHCEKKIDSPHECHLPCRNQGVCVASSSDTTSRNKFQLELEDSVSGMYCQCPAGYAGILCQYQVEVCGDNDLVCLHGSRCVASSDLDYRCECDDPNDRDCNKRIEYCVPRGEHAEYFESMAVPAFCANGGKCKDVVSGNLAQYGCDCPELYYGQHCEFLKSSQDIIEEARVEAAKAASEGARAAQGLRRRGFISLYILVVSLAITAIAWYLRLRWRLRLSVRRTKSGDYDKNLYQFRDENVGVTTANGSIIFPVFYVTRGDAQDGSDEEHLILHDIEIS